MNDTSSSTACYSLYTSTFAYDQNRLFIKEEDLKKKQEDEKIRLESLPLFDPDDLDI